jgi:hypothetical protein
VRDGWLTGLLATTTVPRRQRIALAVVCALLGGYVCWHKNRISPVPRDFGQVWFAARSIVAGVDPYPLVGPHRAYDWRYPLLYPLPAGVAWLPVAALSLHLATVGFVALGCGAFAWALMAWGYGPLFGFLSASVHYAAEVGQFSPLFAASVALPWLGIFLVAKPTVGLAAFVARPSWWAVGGALVFGGIAFAINPHWPRAWLDAVARNDALWAPTVPYRAPITFLGGPLVLLALTRWRRPEARYLVALACVPQTTVLYETVPLFLIPRTFGETVALTALSYLTHLATELVTPQGIVPPSEHLAGAGQMIVLFLYLPAVALLLHRPNRSDLHATAADAPPVDRGRDRVRRALSRVAVLGR